MPSRDTLRGNAAEQPSSRLVAAGQANQRHAAAKGRGVVRRVARAAGQHFGRVVFENQHRRLARHARDATVDELVGDQIAEDDDVGAVKRSMRSSKRSVETARRAFIREYSLAEKSAGLSGICTRIPADAAYLPTCLLAAPPYRRPADPPCPSPANLPTAYLSATCRRRPRQRHEVVAHGRRRAMSGGQWAS